MFVEAPRELDPYAVYSLELIVSAELARVTIADIDEDPHAAAGVDGATLRRIAGELAAAWERLAECLDHLGVWGWSFSGPSSDGQTVYGGLRKAATAAELHTDLAALPPHLRAWLTEEVLLLHRVVSHPTGTRRWRCAFCPSAGDCTVRRRGRPSASRSASANRPGPVGSWHPSRPDPAR